MDEPRHDGGRGKGRITLLGISMVIWIWACATGPQSVEKRQWQCSADADAAVSRQAWHQALQEHEALLRKDPANCLALYHLGYIQGKLGLRSEEVTQYERAVQCGYDQDDRLFFNLAMAYADMRVMDRAIAEFEHAIALNPGSADNYFGLGLTTRAAGQTEAARIALTRAVDIDPRHWEARIALARIYLDEGQLEAARVQLDALHRGAPENEETGELEQIYEERRITSYDR